MRMFNLRSNKQSISIRSHKPTKIGTKIKATRKITTLGSRRTGRTAMRNIVKKRNISCQKTTRQPIKKVKNTKRTYLILIVTSRNKNTISIKRTLETKDVKNKANTIKKEEI